MLASIAMMLSGIAGACGVALFAAAAHIAAAGTPERDALANAALMMMIHAAAGVGLAAFGTASGDRSWAAAAMALVAGALLFGGAVALPKVAGFGLFPMAAPIGGSVTILAWAGVAILAVVTAVRG